MSRRRDDQPPPKIFNKQPNLLPETLQLHRQNGATPQNTTSSSDSNFRFGLLCLTRFALVTLAAYF